MIKGITVTLYDKTLSGYDEFNAPTYTETAVSVNNVLVSPTSSEEMRETVDMYGRRAVYQIAIPKGDTHDWTNKKVSFFGHDFITFGVPIMGIEDNIPLAWNLKVWCEAVE